MVPIKEISKFARGPKERVIGSGNIYLIIYSKVHNNWDMSLAGFERLLLARLLNYPFRIPTSL